MRKHIQVTWHQEAVWTEIRRQVVMKMTLQSSSSCQCDKVAWRNLRTVSFGPLSNVLNVTYSSQCQLIQYNHIIMFSANVYKTKILCMQSTLSISLWTYCPQILRLFQRNPAKQKIDRNFKLYKINYVYRSTTVFFSEHVINVWNQISETTGFSSLLPTRA